MLANVLEYRERVASADVLIKHLAHSSISTGEYLIRQRKIRSLAERVIKPGYQLHLAPKFCAVARFYVPRKS